MKKPLRTALPLPHYVKRKPLRSGVWGYYFEIPVWAKEQGCTLINEALGKDYEAAVEGAEKVLLPAFDSWRTDGASDLVPSGIPARGTFDWLATEFKSSEQFRDLGPRSRKDHDRMLKWLSGVYLKDGRRFGQAQIKDIHPGVVDRLYKHIRFVETVAEYGTKKTRERRTTANRAMATAQTAWNVVHRIHSHAVPSENPFAKMRRKSSGQKTRAATFDQLQAFVSARDQAGHPSIGTAALIAWHWYVREEHILVRC
jgi:hypothetical protein